MTVPSIYQLTHEYRTLLHTLSDLDVDAQTVLDTIESTGLQESIGERVQSRVFVVKSLRNHADAVDAEIKRLTALKRSLSDRADALEESTLALLQGAEIDRIDAPLMVVKVANCPPSVEIYDESQVPADFLKTPPAVPDKTAIKQALTNGWCVPGARIAQRKRLKVS